MSQVKGENWLYDLLRWYFGKKVLPYWCILFADSFIVFVSCLFSVLFVSSDFLFDNICPVSYTALIYSVLSWVGARIFKTYLGVVRYSSFVDLVKIACANAVSVVLALGAELLLQNFGIEALSSAMTPMEVVAAFIIATMLQWALRIIVKLVFDSTGELRSAMPVLIYGAITGGVSLAKSISSRQPQQFKLKGFITHEHKIHDMRLMGVKVYTLEDDIASVLKNEGIEAVLVSPLRVNEFRENQKIQDIIIAAGCKIYMAQEAKEASIRDGELSEEEVESIQLKEVSVEDLLPRQQIRVDLKSVGEELAGKKVLVTGSAGSIGAEIVRQVASFGPAKLMLIDHAESPQHDIRLMMARDFPNVEAETVVTSISRRTRMEEVFSTFKPDYVFHAAAYKHVPMMEDNPSEAVLNNIYGTKIIADLSVRYGARKFVMISTDKAVNPTNVMGCSKRICEIYVQSLDRKLKQDSSADTQFVTTRFGNVLGSNGSVIPLFREQIKNGGPVTVTDERIVRFFMLIPEACKLVLEAGTKGNGGEIFVFDMGSPVKIADLAKRMIALSGAKDVKIEYTGLREGEKLYEEVLSERENTKPTFHEKIRIASVREYDYEDVSRKIDELVEISKHFDNMATVKKMKEIVPEYKSNNSVYEVLDAK